MRVGIRDPHHRRVEVVEALGHADRDDFRGDRAGRPAFLHHHHAVGALEALQNRRLVQRAQSAQVDDLGLDALAAQHLRGFERVHLKPGETRTVTFTLKPEDLALWDRSMRFVVEPGQFKVFAGRSSADPEQLEATFEVTAR